MNFSGQLRGSECLASKPSARKAWAKLEEVTSHATATGSLNLIDGPTTPRFGGAFFDASPTVSEGDGHRGGTGTYFLPAN
jgi:hypothetical protein